MAAKRLFTEAAEQGHRLVAPKLLFYEVLSTAHYYKLPLDPIFDLLQSQIDVTLCLLDPTEAHIRQAFDISSKGHAKSGYPHIYDSIFHAIAIVEKGIFITADKKHFEKTKAFGHISLLK